MNDLVSVVLCTYNGEKFIDEQVQTIRDQTHAHLEIIIIDDASVDTTYQKLEQHARDDQRIRLLRNETNLGFNLNFNRACSLASGEFVAIADQDDIWERAKIEVLVARLKQNEQFMIVHCTSARFSAERRPSLKSISLVNYFEGNDIKRLFLFNPICGHNMLLRKKLLDKALPFPPNVYYDWWLAVKACSMGRIIHVNEILVWHRVHESNITGAAKPELPFYKQVLENLPVMLENLDLSSKDREFGKKMMKLYQRLADSRFSMSLFIFLLTSGRTVFSHKKRRLPFLAYLKNSLKYSLRHTKA